MSDYYWDEVAMSSLKASVTRRQVLKAWTKIVSGTVPLLSIELTKECSLRCPGYYAYRETDLGVSATLRDLSDLRGDALVDGLPAFVRKHQPMHAHRRADPLGHFVTGAIRIGLAMNRIHANTIRPPRWSGNALSVKLVQIHSPPCD